MVDIVEKNPEDRLCDSCKVFENEIHFLYVLTEDVR